MTLNDIIEKFGDLKFAERREMTNDYAEFVLLNTEMDAWIQFFIEELGPAVKPEGAKPTEEDLALTKEYGGIYNGQTLFKKDFDDHHMLAMIWPWGDHKHITLKIAYVAK